MSSTYFGRSGSRSYFPPSYTKPKWQDPNEIHLHSHQWYVGRYEQFVALVSSQHLIPSQLGRLIICLQMDCVVGTREFTSGPFVSLPASWTSEKLEQSKINIKPDL
ncbi:hypothetical protein A0H81_14741 [Grifola frondosa]|uniref:Uncharacterized protein n=1 Tax=Grifola frondosa TaxID=5627 RepID=A0A1C7LKP3_GRIFR|nr:hypothetical protein A0H81_14741 [Grifola frondosa]